MAEETPIEETLASEPQDPTQDPKKKVKGLGSMAQYRTDPMPPIAPLPVAPPKPAVPIFSATQWDSQNDIVDELTQLNWRPSRITEEQAASERRDTAVHEQTYGFQDWVRDVKGNTFGGSVKRWFDKDEPLIDESFKWTPELFYELTHDLPANLLDEFEDVVSETEARSIRADINHRMGVHETLGRSGGWGTVGQMAIDMLDPSFLIGLGLVSTTAKLTIGAAAKSVDYLGAANYGRKLMAANAAKTGAWNAGSLYAGGIHMAKHGLNLGTGMGVVTAAQAYESPIIGDEDIVPAMIGGAAFGAGFGLLGIGKRALVDRIHIPKEGWRMRRKDYDASNLKGDHKTVVLEALKDPKASQGKDNARDHVLFEYYQAERLLKEKPVTDAIIEARGKEYIATLEAESVSRSISNHYRKTPEGVAEFIIRDIGGHGTLTPKQRWAEAREASRKLDEANKEVKHWEGIERQRAKELAKVEGKGKSKALEDAIKHESEARVRVEKAKRKAQAAERSVEKFDIELDSLIKDIKSNPKKYSNLFKDVFNQELIAFGKRVTGGHGKKTAHRYHRKEFITNLPRLLLALGEVKTARKAVLNGRSKGSKAAKRDMNALHEATKKLEKVLHKEHMEVVNKLVNNSAAVKGRRHLHLIEEKANLEKATQSYLNRAEVKGRRAQNEARIKLNELEVAKVRKSVARKARKNAEARRKKLHPFEAQDRLILSKLKARMKADIEAGRRVSESMVNDPVFWGVVKSAKSKGLKIETFSEPKSKGIDLPERVVEAFDKLTPKGERGTHTTKPNMDPLAQRVYDKLLNPLSHLSTGELKAEMRARNLQYTNNTLPSKMRDMIREADLAEIHKDYDGMGKLITYLRNSGFEFKAKGKSREKRTAQLKEYREAVSKNHERNVKEQELQQGEASQRFNEEWKFPEKPTGPEMKPTEPLNFIEGLNKTREAYKAQGKNVDLQVSAVTEVEARAIVDEGGTLLITKDGMMGGYIKADGYMGGLFSHPDAGGGATKAFVAQIQKYGGTHAESYATYLEPLYAKLGWKPVARIKFNVEYAPKGWNAKDSVLRGKPDVVFYSYEPNMAHTAGKGRLVKGENAYDGALAIAKELGAKAKASRGKAPKVETKEVKGPEPEPVSDAVAMGGFNKAATIVWQPVRKWFNKVSMSFTAEVGTLETHGALRWIGGNVLQDSMPKRNPVTGAMEPVNMTAISKAHMETNALFSRNGELYGHAEKAWKKANSSTFDTMINRSEELFGEEVSKVLRGIYKGKDPNVLAAAKAARSSLKAMEKRLVDSGLIEAPYKEANYFPRKINTTKVIKAIKEYKTEGEYGSNKLADELVSPAILKAHNAKAVELKQDLMTVEESQFLGRAWMSNIHKRGTSVDYRSNGFLGEHSGQTLRDYLELIKTPEHHIKNILDKTRLNREAKTEGFNHHRLLMDEGFSVDMVNAKGVTNRLALTDFFDNNTHRVIQTYVRNANGAIEWRDIGLRFNEMRGLSNKANPNPASTKDMWEFIQRDMGLQGRSINEITKAESALQRMEAAVRGRAFGKQGELTTLSRVLQKISGAVYGGSFGIAGVAELGQPLAHSSIKAWAAHLGDLGPMLRAYSRGEVPKGLQREIATLTGVGTDGKAFRQVATMFEHYPMGKSEHMSAFENFAGNAQQKVLTYGGLIPLDAIQRQYTASLFVQHLLNSSLSGKAPYNPTRLAGIGLTTAESEVIMSMLKKHASYSGGLHKLRLMNIDKWEGAEGQAAGHSLRNAIYLHTQKVIHQSHEGNIPHWAQNPLMRTLFQFRFFGMGSLETQLLANLHAGDRRAVGSFMMNTFFGMISFMGIMGNKYGHDPEKLAEYMTMEELAKGAIARSGWYANTGGVVDDIMTVAGLEPLNPYRRGRGMSTGLNFDNTPIGSLLLSPPKLLQNLIAGDAFTEENGRVARRIGVAQNVPVISYAYGKMIDMMPEKGEE
tara:strand:+ start:13586 stop:19444 length:5859 start_codon:yes stop_codon:yes gene_type:complete